MCHSMTAPCSNSFIQNSLKGMLGLHMTTQRTTGAALITVDYNIETCCFRRGAVAAPCPSLLT